MPRISIEDISYSYGDSSDGFVLDGIDLEMGEGELVCIVGDSGCGKTTLLRLIAGLEVPSTGRVSVDGRLVGGPADNTAFVFQQYPLFPWMRVLRNVEYGALHSVVSRTKTQATALARQYLAEVGMLDAAQKYPYQLSGGMRQRVAIARALAQEPRLLLLDEPFGALDVKRRMELQKLVENLWASSASDINVIFVTHDIDEALLLADRIVFMRPGQIEDVLEVDLPRPRVGSAVMSTPAYARLREKLMRLFFQDKKESGERHA